MPGANKHLRPEPGLVSSRAVPTGGSATPPALPRYCAGKCRVAYARK